MKKLFNPNIRYVISETAATVLSGAIGAAGSLGASAMSGVASGKINKRTERYNKWALKEQQDFALAQWNRENAYNSPVALRQRLIDAGLNPNLIYGSLGVTGGFSLPAVPSAQSLSQFAPDFSGVGHIADTYLQSKLINAQIKNLEGQSDLSRAEAFRIYKITPAEFQKISNDAEAIRQKIDSQEFQTVVEQLKAKSLKENGEFSFSDINGNQIVTDFKSLIFDNAIKGLYSSNLDYEFAIKTFLNKVGLSNFKLEEQRLKNEDLKAFVDVCARIYESDAKQADYLGAVAEMNQRTYGALGASNDVIKLIYGFLELILNGVGTFRPPRRTNMINAQTVNY